MKLKVLIFCVSIFAFFIFTSSSPWEGAAVTAPDGELPASGFFIATNSFPRNTMVDITNIETDSTVRAIVANTLDTPGLLAMVSPEAADALGMRRGSISRIRMTQPADPLAHLRLSERAATGVLRPVPEDVIAEEGFAEITDESPRVDTFLVRELPTVRETVDRHEEPPVVDTRPFFLREADPMHEERPAVDARPYFMEPEWAERHGRFIVDFPIAAPEPEPEPAPPVIPEFELVRAEERPPEYVAFVIDPALIIPSIVRTPPRVVEERDYQIEPSRIIPEIVRAPREVEVVEEEEFQVSPAFIVSEIVRVPLEIEEEEEFQVSPAFIIPEIVQAPYEVEEEREFEICPLKIIPEISKPVAPEPVIEEALVVEAPPVITEPQFSIPRIFQLEHGSYYVQIAAFDSPEPVEITAGRIDHSFKPVVYKDGDHWYRVLLGPMNQGESLAVLQRFRSIGFNDAFIRQGR